MPLMVTGSGGYVSHSDVFVKLMPSLVWSLI